MKKQQKLEWSGAQNIVISEDLVAAAKLQLQFLAAVDRNQNLYDGPALDHAIRRYKFCWLPLLAKHTSSPVSEDPLVVPLDCEWIWHCHRLNPVRYEIDCRHMYGRILDTQNVLSSVKSPYSKQTETIWNSFYPNEPYELNVVGHLTKSDDGDIVKALRSTNYDLVAAVKRQSSFFKQVSHMNNDAFLEQAVKKYKGFLHLIRGNRKSFCVPTLDIDLIWHSHQLSPVSYSNDMMALLGTLLGHDDTDPDRTEVGKVAIGFSSTTSMWEETFGMRYAKATTKNGDSAPSPLNIIDGKLNSVTKEEVSFNEIRSSNPHAQRELEQVMLQDVAIEDLPERHKDTLFAQVSKTNSTDSSICIVQLKTMLKSKDSKDASICIAQPKTMFKDTDSVNASICIATNSMDASITRPNTMLKCKNSVDANLCVAQSKTTLKDIDFVDASICIATKYMDISIYIAQPSSLVKCTHSMDANLRVSQPKTMLNCTEFMDARICIAQPKAMLKYTNSVDASICIAQSKTMLKCLDSMDASICIAQPKSMLKCKNSMGANICVA